MLRLLFILLFSISSIFAKLNLEVVAEHNGSGYTLQSGDSIFVGDEIKFYYSSTKEVDLSIFTADNGKKEKQYSQQLEKDISYSFPPLENDWITLDKNSSIQTFIFKLNNETVKTFTLNQISQEINASKNLKAIPTKNSIENREYIDLSKVESNTRGSTDIKVFKTLSNATVIVKTKDEMGAGVIISKEGKILTNWHVVKDNPIVTIAFKPRIGNKPSQGNYYNAKVMYSDKTKDLALLQLLNTEIVTDKQIEPIKFSKIEDIDVGEDIYTIGHPIGYYFSLGNGIVSNLLNDHSWETKNIQHQAQYVIKSQTPISSGNSGGALVNKDVQLLGLMTFSDTQGQNLNFAISIKDIRNFINHSTNKNNKANASPTKNMRETAFMPTGKPVIIKEINVYDLNGNPMLLQKLDTNNNGIADTIKLDTNNDNHWDRIYYDKDEDGIIEKWRNI